MEIVFTKSARRHKIGRERVRYVIGNPYMVVRQPPPPDMPDERLIFLGDDHTGRALEVGVIRDRDAFVVIHAMDLRDKWRPDYERGKSYEA